MVLPSAFLEELRARTPLAPLVGRRVKLVRSGRQWKGCCPFHDEKTPSFHVYDDGYHCFGCGAHGDAIGFVMQTEGAEFLDAVRQLAGEAGLEVPKPSPQAAAAEQRRIDLHGLLDAAEQHFCRRLRAPEGQAALDYLRRRGLSDETIDGFGLGWASDGRRLADALGSPPALLAEAGLMTETAEGRLRDLFFRRITIPIRDARGRTIGFGGRVLGDELPKYLNGPETALFSKRRTLFGLDRAREAMRHAATVVVVEGYLDVIVLHQSGIGGAVAPLGTALTEEQLEALWRLTDAPVLCFDGDAAGARAALRAMTLALPLLAPHRTLAIRRLPPGEDPDSFVRKYGADRFATLRDQSVWEALYDALRQGAGTPEQHAAFRDRLEAAAKAVRHPALASEYRRAFLERFFAERRRPAGKRPSLSAAAASAPERDPNARRALIMLALALHHPALAHAHEETLGQLHLPARIAPVREAIFQWIASAETLEAGALMDHLRTLGHADTASTLLASLAAELPTVARAGAVTAEVEQYFRHFAGQLRRESVQRDLAAATHLAASDDAALRRVQALREELLGLDAADFAAI